MISLKPSDIERMTKELFGYDVSYIGVFVDEQGRKPYPKKFALWNKDGKILSIDERHYINYLKTKK